MVAMTIEPCGALTYAIDAEFGRDGRAIGINRGLRQLVCFVNSRGQSLGICQRIKILRIAIATKIMLFDYYET